VRFKQLEEEIHGAVAALSEREKRLWERVKIEPSKWAQEQYAVSGGVWVVAVLGTTCLYFNGVEKGWGWGKFNSWGKVSSYHWQQDEIQHVIAHTLFAIDNGGSS